MKNRNLLNGALKYPSACRFYLWCDGRCHAKSGSRYALDMDRDVDQLRPAIFQENVFRLNILVTFSVLLAVRNEY